MTSPFLINEESLYDKFPEWYAPTPGYVHGTPTSPSNISYVGSSNGWPVQGATPSQTSDKLPLLGLDEWQAGMVYDEQPPTCIHYSIEWKVALNKRVVSDDTEPNQVLAPSAYWEKFLKSKLGRVVGQKFSPDQRVRSDDTAITVTVNDRSERKLTKRFEKTNIDWSSVEDQLLSWGDLFRAGKKIRLLITFHHLGDSRSSPKKGDKRGSSATKRMQAEMEDQLTAERSSGLGETWREVYQLMRCRDRLCKQGPHCLEDPTSQKHYSLTTHHLQSLIGFVNGGGTLRSERDIPEWFYKQLKAEEQVLNTKSKDKTLSSHGTPCPPINIVLPTQSSPSSTSTANLATTPGPPLSQACHHQRLQIHGSRDAAVKEYSEWHASEVDDEDLKNDFRKACHVALKNGLDLQQIVNRPDPNFFIEREVKIGTAYRFVDDIVEWVEIRRGRVDD
ncbi:hypothetical protein N7490_003553 [Penicillium lividum]|nr:hypothetical protein N7490_003553 [Penicillium lividum]